jgi:hypothetical protein
MNDTTKLPKWAQDHIKDLQRQRDEAVKTLNRSLDSQTKTAIWFEQHPCTGEQKGPSFKRSYVQSDRIAFAANGSVYELCLHDGVVLRVNEGGLQLEIRPRCSSSIEICAGRR